MELKEYTKKKIVLFSGSVVHCNVYDEDKVTGNGNAGISDAIGPTEIDYPSLHMKGIIVVPKSICDKFLAKSGGDIEEARDEINLLLSQELVRAVPFEINVVDSKYKINYLDEMGHAQLWEFEMYAIGIEPCAKRPPIY